MKAGTIIITCATAVQGFGLTCNSQNQIKNSSLEAVSSGRRDFLRTAAAAGFATVAASPNVVQALDMDAFMNNEVSRRRVISDD